MAERRETWTNAETQTTFECPRSLLCELAGLAMAGFNLSPAGGPEIGGILFGTRTPGHVRIVTHRPLPCEHAFGPAFELTDRDKSDLERLLLNPELTDLERETVPVGWYRSEYWSLCLTQNSLDLHEKYFPEPWHLAIVLHRAQAQPVRIGFFGRTRNGTMQSSVPTHELVVDPREPSTAAPVWEANSPLIEPEPPTAADRDILSTLLDGVLNHSGIMLATCAPGAEFELLLQLGDSLKEKSIEFAVLVDAPANTRQFYQMLTVDLGLKCSRISQTQQTAAFREFLEAQDKRGSTTALIIDNSQMLPIEVFHEVQRLNELMGTQGRLLQTVLIAAPEIEQRLRSPELLGFWRRIQIRTDLPVRAPR